MAEGGVRQALNDQPPQREGQLAQPSQLNIGAAGEHAVDQLVKHLGLLAQELGQGEHVLLGSGMDSLQRRHQLPAHAAADVVTELVGLDGRELAVGKRFQIKQPKLPTLVWRVIDLEPGVSWTWAQRSAGGSTLAHHTLSPLPEGRTLVRQTLDQRGPIGAIVGRLMRGTTRRYLAMEAQGLKDRSEQLRHSHGPAS